jgi:PAS domain S-box-containing protein
MKQINQSYRQLENADKVKLAPTHEPDTRSAEELLHELQTHQAELEIQNNALRVALIAFEESVESYVTLYDQSPVGYCTISEHGLILQANITSATLLDMERQALTKQPIARFVFKADQDIFYLLHKQLLKTSESQECELRMVKGDGTQFWAHLAATAVKDGDGAPVLRIALSDVTKRKQLDESVRESERFMKTLTDFMPSMVGYWTKDLRAMFVNREHVNWFGKSQEEIKGIRIRDLLGEELFCQSEPHILAALAGEAQEFELTLTRANGEKRETLSYFTPYRVENEVQGFFVLILDVTERKHLEEALISVAEERQRSMGQELHDNLGQQLAAMSYQSKALENKLRTSGDADSASIAASIAAQAQNAVKHCKQLAQSMLPFELEANGLMDALQAFASRVATTYQITCDFVCPNEVVIDDANLALNLYRIAQEAVNNAIRHGGARHLTISLASKEGLLRLSICDDGCGFFGADTKHIATPGMGIKIMQYRAAQLGASLIFLSRAEGGTEVRVKMKKVQPC